MTTAGFATTVSLAEAVLFSQQVVRVLGPPFTSQTDASHTLMRSLS